MPLMYRKWFARQAEKHLTKQNNKTNEPLSKEEKKKIIEQNKKYTNDPSKLTNIFQPMKK